MKSLQDWQALEEGARREAAAEPPSAPRAVRVGPRSQRATALCPGAPEGMDTVLRARSVLQRGGD